MTALEAFQSIGVQYQPFDVQRARMPQDEKQFLGQLFGLIEQAVLQRVETMRILSRSGDPDVHVNEFVSIEKRIRALAVPKRSLEEHPRACDRGDRRTKAFHRGMARAGASGPASRCGFPPAGRQFKREAARRLFSFDGALSE
jgi:hypothetical protein